MTIYAYLAGTELVPDQRYALRGSQLCVVGLDTGPTQTWSPIRFTSPRYSAPLSHLLSYRLQTPSPLVVLRIISS
jgi:hypothetical protein